MAKQTFTTGQVLTAAQMTNLQQTAMGGGTAVVKTASYVLVAADAGTVIQMNSASSTTITVNTALFAAGDSVFIQNIGAGVCTVTAGTATVTTAGSLALTQWEGGQLYFTSTSASIFFDYIQAGTSIPLTTKGDLFGFDTANARIPIGSNNQVLTADSAQALGLKWATPSSGTVVKVQAATSNTQVSVSTGTFIDTGLTVSITPSASTSKVLIMADPMFYASGTSLMASARITRAGTSVYQVDRAMQGVTSQGWKIPLMYLDSPATTSATTYVIQFALFSGTGSIVYANTSAAIGSIIVMEIGA